MKKLEKGYSITKICYRIYAWGIEKTVPLKSLFVLSRYLNRLPRYHDSKYSYRLRQRAIYEWIHDPVTYIFFLETRTTFFQESRLPLVCSLGQVRETRCEREARINNKDADSKRLKNYLSLYTTISREPEVVSKQIKKRFKGEDSPLLMIVHSLIGNHYLRSYSNSNFFLILIGFKQFKVND